MELIIARLKLLDVQNNILAALSAAAIAGIFAWSIKDH